MAAGCRFSTFVEDLEHCDNDDDGHDDDCGGDGDRKLDGSNGSSNACVGGERDVQPVHPPRLLDSHYDGHQTIFNCCQQGFKDPHQITLQQHFMSLPFHLFCSCHWFQTVKAAQDKFTHGD